MRQWVQLVIPYTTRFDLLGVVEIDTVTIPVPQLPMRTFTHLGDAEHHPPVHDGLGRPPVGVIREGDSHDKHT